MKVTALAPVRGGVWTAAAALVVLAAHVLVYALAPRPSLIGTKLEYEAGGPAVLVLALVVLAIAGALSAALLVVVSVGVAERARLEPSAPAIRRISAVRVGGQAVGLWLATCLAFALVESYVHWRAGLGWHGLHCLVGPAHRDAIPILGGLSLVAAAIVAVATHLVAWMRRAIAALGCRLPRPCHPPASVAVPVGVLRPRRRRVETRLGARGPPFPVSSLARRRDTPPSAKTTRRRSRDMRGIHTRRGALALTAATFAGLVLAGGAWAHAIVSPPVATAKALQQFTLSVPTEKEKLTTTTIELTVPSGFAIDSFEPAPDGWKQQVQSTGSGEEAVVQKVTWTGGSVPTGEDAVFRFNASAAGSKTYTFDVRQTYSDGSLVDWNGPESSDNPAPKVEGVSSLGGSSNSLLAVVALVVGALGLLVGVLALAGGRRSLT